MNHEIANILTGNVFRWSMFTQYLCVLSFGAYVNTAFMKSRHADLTCKSSWIENWSVANQTKTI